MKECHQCKEPYDPDPTKQWYGCQCCDAIYCAECFLTLDPADERMNEWPSISNKNQM